MGDTERKRDVYEVLGASGMSVSRNVNITMMPGVAICGIADPRQLRQVSKDHWTGGATAYGSSYSLSMR